jgi:hypothetical protein
MWTHIRPTYVAVCGPTYVAVCGSTAHSVRTQLPLHVDPYRWDLQCSRCSPLPGLQRTATSVCGLKVLLYAALSTSVCGLKLLVYEALSYWCMRPEAADVCGLKLLMYEASSY